MLVRDTLNPLLGEAPDPAFVRHVKEKIEKAPGVLGSHDLLVHDYGPGRRFASAHVEMSAETDLMESHDLIDDIERDFLRNDRLHLVLHLDPVVTDPRHLDPARSRAVAALAEIDPRLHLHDFRLVNGKLHDNYIFDVLTPENFSMPPDELIQRIEDGLQTAAPRPVHAHIHIDSSYSPVQP